MNVNKKPLRQSRKIDQSLLWAIILLAAFGILMVYSSSVAWEAFDRDSRSFIRDPLRLVGRHVINVAAGSVFALAAFFAGMSFWQRFSTQILFLSIALLGVVGFWAKEVNGARRWLNLWMFNVQPSEMFKLAVILYLSAFFCRRADVLQQKKSMWFPCIVLGIGLGLVLAEPDLGATFITAVIAFGLFFLANLPKSWFFTGLAAGAAGLVVTVFAMPYRISRMMVFLDPWAQAFDKGYQTTHALMGIAGGRFGKTLLYDQQRNTYRFHLYHGGRRIRHGRYPSHDIRLWLAVLAGVFDRQEGARFGKVF